jgi:hypothetical protein
MSVICTVWCDVRALKLWSASELRALQVDDYRDAGEGNGAGHNAEPERRPRSLWGWGIRSRHGGFSHNLGVVHMQPQNLRQESKLWISALHGGKGILVVQWAKQEDNYLPPSWFGMLDCCSKVTIASQENPVTFIVVVLLSMKNNSGECITNKLCNKFRGPTSCPINMCVLPIQESTSYQKVDARLFTIRS